MKEPQHKAYSTAKDRRHILDINKAKQLVVTSLCW